MNFKATLFTCFTFLLLSVLRLSAQTDTIPYKVGTYDITKQIKVYAIAARLSVDPNTIVKLNKFRNTQQDLYPGQRIKIPVYPKGYKYEPEKVVVHKKVDLDSAALALLYADTAKEVSYNPFTYITVSEAKDRLMMIEAYIELNDAMLQGVQASIDTLNAVNNDAVDEKNIQAMLLKMKRSRDRVLLLPYLEHIRDSIQTEIITLKKDKLQLDRIISPPVVANVESNSSEHKPTTTSANTTSTEKQTDVIPATDVETPYAVVIDTIAEAKLIEKDDDKRIEVKKNEQKKNKYKNNFPIDTIIVYDAAPVLGMKPEPEKKKIPETAIVKKGDYWDTAHAIMPVDTALFNKPIVMPTDTLASIKIKIPNTLDSVVIKPIKPIPAKQDSTKQVVANKVEKTPTPNAKKDTVVTAIVNEPVKPEKIAAIDSVVAVVKSPDTAQLVTPVVLEKTDSAASVEVAPQKTEVKKTSVADMAIASSDSVKRIKAEFFYRRAQKAITEKNFRNAEQYLDKSIELYPRYYDAWYAKAEMNDLFGAYGSALKEYQTCMSIDSSKPLLFYKMGLLLNRMKRKTEAFNNFNKAIELNPDYVQALMERAQTYSDWKKYDLAVEDYNRVVQVNRSYHFAYKQRGHVYMLNRDYAKAIDDFTRYLIFEETDPAAYYYRGLAKIGHSDLLEGCLDLSTASSMGYTAAEKAIKRSCQ
ncbi:MAG: tetratricopeptide repeat protein [Chitinophagales bacterium]|nr:tetratricopeptide repeat protein [Chitinophagales bacterium]